MSKKRKIIIVAFILTSGVFGWINLPQHRENQIVPSKPNKKSEIISKKAFKNSKEIEHYSKLEAKDSNANNQVLNNENTLAQEKWPASKPKEVVVDTKDGKKSYPNRMYHALYEPNEYPNQWHTNIIDAPAAWDKSIGSLNTIVAVIDTGFALNHDEFFNRWAVNSAETPDNSIDDDNNGLIDDYVGWDFYGADNSVLPGDVNPNDTRASHGSLVTGLVGTSGDNSLGTVGVNWRTQILPLQGLNDEGDGFSSDIADAIDYAIARDADVINMSFGGQDPDPILEAALTRAYNAGIILVAASGNDGCNCLSYPANYETVLSVGATDVNDNIASFSSYGTNLDVVAPGYAVTSSPAWSPSNAQNLYRNNLFGTSFAAPIVSGMAATLIFHSPTSTNQQIYDAIKANSEHVPGMDNPSEAIKYGSGRVNLNDTLDAISPGLSPIEHTPTTPLFKLTKGSKEISTTLFDKRDELVFLKGYNYEIIRFMKKF